MDIGFEQKETKVIKPHLPFVFLVALGGKNSKLLYLGDCCKKYYASTI